jgi:catechol 2,3-dioxygenase-like lactoylglutathione lyase family enzyme
MDVRFVASVSVVTSDPAVDKRLFVDALGLPLHPPEIEGSDYLFTDQLEGVKHLGVWPLAEAAESCFGVPEWPGSHPVPHASIEFEVEDVAASAAELTGRGYRLVHAARQEPWGQTVARLQTHDGLLVGLSYTPWMHDGST